MTSLDVFGFIYFGTHYARTESRTYNVNGQLATLNWAFAGTGGTTTQTLTYGYSTTLNNGQITQVTDGVSGKTAGDGVLRDFGGGTRPSCHCRLPWLHFRDVNAHDRGIPHGIAPVRKPLRMIDVSEELPVKVTRADGDEKSPLMEVGSGYFRRLYFQSR